MVPRLFKDVVSELISLFDKIQDAQQCMYGIQKFEDYHFICFFDQTSKSMNTTITDVNMVEIKMLSELDVYVKAAFGAFNHAVILWEKGEGEFPAEVSSDEQLLNLLQVKYKSSPSNKELSIESDYKLE